MLRWLVAAVGLAGAATMTEDERCQACLRLVHDLHPALKTHVENRATIPRGYWTHVVERVCAPGTPCEGAFLLPYGEHIALELADLFEAADGDPDDSSVKAPNALFSALCAPDSVTSACRRRPASGSKPSPTPPGGTMAVIVLSELVIAQALGSRGTSGGAKAA